MLSSTTSTRLQHWRPGRLAVVAAGAGMVATVGLTGCGAKLEGASTPSTRAAVSPTQYCEEGKTLAQQVQALDRKKPEYLDSVKKLFKSFGAKAPDAVADDMAAYVTYIQQVTAADQLQREKQSADITVTTDRIDRWWRENCGSKFGG